MVLILFFINNIIYFFFFCIIGGFIDKFYVFFEVGFEYIFVMWSVGGLYK